jgi:hypothetical protein
MDSMDNITVTVDMLDGSQITPELAKGSRISTLALPKDCVVVLNGVAESGDVELRDGDEITVNKKSQKAE